MTDWLITTSQKFMTDAHKAVSPSLAALITAYGRMICDDWMLAARDARRLMSGRAA